MFVQLSKSTQEDLIREAVEKAGSYRKLSKILKIPRSSLDGYKKSESIPQERFLKIINFVEKDSEKLNPKILEKNWKQKIGGINCVKSKKAKGTFNKDLKKAQRLGTKKIKEWHKNMKLFEPRKYHLMQYDKFKKIGGYKYKTKKGEQVRNIFEKKVADILYKLGINYEYEPLIKSQGKYFFPDFLINKKIILECTAWKGETKAYKLKEKIEYLKNEYKVFVVIPKNLYSYYKILDDYLLKGIEEFVPVAQTFLIHKK